MDILSEIESKPEVSPTPPVSSRSAAREAAKAAGASKPSAYEADLRVKLRDKVQCNIGGIPRFVSEEFERLVATSGMSKKEYFYHLLRGQGADIPPYDTMDGRKL
jgi:hypothetical protein